jgi:mannosyltransferase OCH1-like enzyme
MSKIIIIINSDFDLGKFVKKLPQSLKLFIKQYRSHLLTEVTEDFRHKSRKTHSFSKK